jgi:hydroxymethylpyrimidine pyrophosphatase-like HAD family hydrolase
MYRIVALDGDGTSLDEERIDFRCHRVIEERPN